MPKKADLGKKLNRRQQRDLDIEIGFMRGVVQRDPSFVEALQILGDDYTRRGRFLDGLKVDEQLVKLRPEDPTMLYNLACSYALTKRYEQAASALSRAIERGYRDFKWLVKDPDLQGLRAHPIFKNIQTKIRKVQIQVK
jgi:tetratricopeptide (TPR) repeat protein